MTNAMTILDEIRTFFAAQAKGAKLMTTLPDGYRPMLSDYRKVSVSLSNGTGMMPFPSISQTPISRRPR